MNIKIRRICGSCIEDKKFHLVRDCISRPQIIVIVENGRVARIAIVPESASLETPQLADYPISGLLAPHFSRAPLVTSRCELQLLLSQPREAEII